MATLWLSICQIAFAQAPEPEARVTRIIHDVQLMPAQATARPAVLDEKVDEHTGVRTGEDSRSELTFGDLTITRLGANTIFTFNKPGRSVQLESGSILLYVKKGSGAAQLSTSAVTVGVTGTTVILETTPDAANALTVLEGTARLSLNQNPIESSLVYAGQRLAVQPGATKLSRPEKVDLRQIMQTHPLIVDFPPLPSQDLILAETDGRGPAGRGPRGRNAPPPPGSWPVGVPKPTPRPAPTYRPAPKPTPRPSPGHPGIGPPKGPKPMPPPRKRPTPKKRPTPTPTPVIP